MAQSTGMSATSAAGTGAHQRAAAVLAVAAHCHDDAGAAGRARRRGGRYRTHRGVIDARGTRGAIGQPRGRRAAPAGARLRRRSRRAGRLDGFRVAAVGAFGPDGNGGLAFAFYLLFMRGRGGAGSATSGWGSYYLFWIVAPALLAAVSSHPAFLIIIVVGLVARRWLPDPFLFLKHQGRVRSLQADIDTNAVQCDRAPRSRRRSGWRSIGRGARCRCWTRRSRAIRIRSSSCTCRASRTFWPATTKRPSPRWSRWCIASRTFSTARRTCARRTR